MKRILTIVLALALTSAPALAATRHVSPFSSDFGAGSSGRLLGAAAASSPLTLQQLLSEFQACSAQGKPNGCITPSTMQDLVGTTVPSVSPSVAAAGSSQGTATSLSSQIDYITSGSGGVSIPQFLTVAGQGFVICSTIPTNLSVYPPNGASILTSTGVLSANTPVQIVQYQCTNLNVISPTLLTQASTVSVTTAAGGTTAVSFSNVAGRVLTPYDFGAPGPDAVRPSTNGGNSPACNVTVTSGGNTLTINSGPCSFSAGTDVGKNLVLFDAGVNLSTAPISSVAVNAAGSAYTSIPPVTVADATGSDTQIYANEGLDTATVVSGGSGCTTGTQTFTLSGGTAATAAQFTGTVSGGALGGTLTITVAGSYSALPSTAAASATGGGCSTAPTVSNTWHQVAPTVAFAGVNFTAPTAGYGTAGLSAATVASGGSGCTNGSATFNVRGGFPTGAIAQVTGTVTGGTLSGSLTVTTPGTYIYWTPSTTVAPITGGGCTTPPTISTTWTYTGGGSASLSTPVLATPGIVPYSGTITGVISSNVITVSGTFGQNITNSAHWLSWGHDNAAGINSLIAEVAETGTANTAVCGFLPVPQSGQFWGVASPIVFDPGGLPSCLKGAGWGLSQVLALTPMSELVYKDGNFIYGGGTYEDLYFDGNKLATSTAYLVCPDQMKFNDDTFANSASADGAPGFSWMYSDLIVGSGTQSGCVNARFTNVNAYQYTQFYNGYQDAPLTAVVINTTDTHWFGLQTGGAKAHASIYVNSTAFNTNITSAHASSGLVYPTFCYYLGSITTTLSMTCDGTALVGYDIPPSPAGEVSIAGGFLENAQNPATNIGVLIGSGASNISVNSLDLSRITTAANAIVQNGTQGSKVYTWGNKGAVDFSPLPLALGTAQNSLCTGYLACNSWTSGTGTAYGTGALQSFTTATGLAAFGFDAGYYTTGSNNAFFGGASGQFATSGSNNTFFGQTAGEGISGTRLTGGSNAGFGEASLTNLQGAAADNAALGQNAGSSITTGGSNLVLGRAVASTTLTTGSRDILLGTASNCTTAAGSTSDEFEICDSTTSALWLSGSLVAGSETAIFTPPVTAPGFVSTALAPTVAAGQISYGGTTVAASNCGSLAGSAGCIVTNIAGTIHYVPYW